MEQSYLETLARVVLPSQILDYFTVVGVSQSEQEIHISLDEKASPELCDDVHFECKGLHVGCKRHGFSDPRPQGDTQHKTPPLDGCPHRKKFHSPHRP